MSKKSHCCYIAPYSDSKGHGDQCKADAEWTITFGPGPDDYTEVCTAHVGDMLVPDVANIVLPIAE